MWDCVSACRIVSDGARARALLRQVASSSEKQWPAAEKNLRQVVESFRMGVAESLSA